MVTHPPSNGEVVAIDGNVLRRSADKAWGLAAIQMVNKKQQADYVVRVKGSQATRHPHIQNTKRFRCPNSHLNVSRLCVLDLYHTIFALSLGDSLKICLCPSTPTMRRKRGHWSGARAVPTPEAAVIPPRRS